MMKKIFISLMTLFVLLFALHANESTSKLFLQANDNYKKGNYDTAVVIYKKIIAAGFESPELYYNLGNAFYKGKQIPEAILYYEKAKKLDPSDDEIITNLQLAQSQITDKIMPLPGFILTRWVSDFSDKLSANSWAYVSLFAFIFTLILTSIYLFTRILALKKSCFWLGILVLFVCAFSFANSYNQKQLTINSNEAIVMTPSITVKSSPDEKGTDLFVIHEGLKVKIVDEVGEWREIKIADGNKGWLKISDIEKI